MNKKTGVILGTILLVLLTTGIGSAANGDNLRNFTAANPGGCGLNTGLAFDGTHLLITCYYNNKIDLVSTLDGSLINTITVSGQSSLGAAAWDNSRKKLWVCDVSTNNVILVNTTDGSNTVMFHSNGCMDGLAYDGADDTIWASPDANPVVTHYKTDGTILSTNNVGTNLSGYGNSGIAVGGEKLYLANDGGSQIYEVSKDFSSYTLFATFPRRLEDMECDDLTFASAGVGAIWSQDAYDRILNAYEIPKGKCAFGGQSSGSSFTVTKDFRFTDVNFTATPAQLGALLPQNGSKYNVTYVTKPKDGTVSSTNPGQLYGVITVNGTGVANVTVNDSFGTQFVVNPAHLNGGVEVLRVNTTTGNAVVITNTPQITSATVSAAGPVNLTIKLTTPLASDEKLMIYIKFMTALKGSLPNLNDFVNMADVLVNGSPGTASATINFV